MHPLSIFFFFFFNDTATTEIYTLSLHDALPISDQLWPTSRWFPASRRIPFIPTVNTLQRSNCPSSPRSEEHTSELQSPCNLVCRLLLEKKKKIIKLTSIKLSIVDSYRLSYYESV